MTPSPKKRVPKVSGAYKQFWKTYTLLGMEAAFERGIADTKRAEMRKKRTCKHCGKKT